MGEGQGVERQQLSVRQVEILALVSEGLTNQQVAARLGVTPQTVGLHLSVIFRTIGVTNRTAAVRWAERHGAFDSPRA